MIKPGRHTTRNGQTVTVRENHARSGDGLPFIVSMRSRTWTCDAEGRLFGDRESEWDVVTCE